MFLMIPLGGCTAALLALLWWQASAAQRRPRQMTIVLLGALTQASWHAEAHAIAFLKPGGPVETRNSKPCQPRTYACIGSSTKPPSTWWSNASAPFTAASRSGARSMPPGFRNASCWTDLLRRNPLATLIVIVINDQHQFTAEKPEIAIDRQGHLSVYLDSNLEAIFAPGWWTYLRFLPDTPEAAEYLATEVAVDALAAVTR